MELDAYDRKLLYALDMNARESLTRLGKATRMSKQRVKYRLKRLEEQGIIKGYYPLVDTTRLGYTQFRVYLKLRHASKEERRAVIEHLTTLKEVWAVVTFAGKWDLALGVAVKDIYQFYDVWSAILNAHLPHIHDYAIHLYSPIEYFTKSYLLDEENTDPIRILGGHQEAEHDETDLAILRALGRDARQSLVDIAQDIDATAETVRVRLKRLESSGIIQGYRPLIDTAALGYEFYKAEIRLTDYNQYPRIREWCHRHPSVTEIDNAIGGAMLEIVFHVQSLQEMLDAMDAFSNDFPEIIETWDYLTVLSEEKVTYMPGS